MGHDDAVQVHDAYVPACQFGPKTSMEEEEISRIEKKISACSPLFEAEGADFEGLRKSFKKKSQK